MTQAPNSSLILCSTPRLARSLQLIFQREQVQKGISKWQPLNAVPLSQWLGQILDEDLLLGRIDVDQIPPSELSTLQETLLWEQSIQFCLKNYDAKDLFDASGLASAAMEANRLLIEWHLDIDIDEATEETRQFLEWQKHFQSLCKKNGYLESVRYNDRLLKLLERGVGSLPAQIEFAGFDRINPQLTRLQSVLEKRGVKVSLASLTYDTPQEAHHVPLTDQDRECRAAAAWAKMQLSANPNARIAIVVPELAALRSKLSALLDDVLHPSSVRPALAESQRIYDFSLGVPLNTLACHCMCNSIATICMGAR
jgi:hypothetical protein